MDVRHVRVKPDPTLSRGRPRQNFLDFVAWTSPSAAEPFAETGTESEAGTESLPFKTHKPARTHVPCAGPGRS